MGKIIAGFFCAISFPLLLSTQGTHAAEKQEKGTAGNRFLPVNALSHASLSEFINKSVCTDVEPLQLIIEAGGSRERCLAESLLADVRRAPNEWLVIPHQRVKIKCKEGTIHADKESILLISQGAGYMAIHNLHEHHFHSIYFEIDNARIPITMASELLIAKSPDELTKLLARCPLARRRLKIEHNSAAQCIATSEVKMVDLLKRSKILTELRADNQFEADKKLKDQLIKSAACVSVVSAFHGPYHRFITGEKELVPAVHPDTIHEISNSSQHPSKGGCASAL